MNFYGLRSIIIYPNSSSIYSAMLSGICKKCNNLFFLQLALFKSIVNMP